MIYLSRLVLDPKSRQVKSELADPYEMHRTLAKAFGDGSGEFAAARCLFRVDDHPLDDRPVVLVQSKTEPDWDTLAARQAYLTERPAVKALALSIRPDQRLAFRLLANPTVCREGKRHGLQTEEDQIAWLQRKGKAGGFRIVQVRVVDLGRCRAKHGSATFTRVRFDGTLIVVDPALLQDALESGIGPAKGLGFGLLSLAPLRA